MKRFSHAFLAFVVALVSCQCVALADTSVAQLEQACHDVMIPLDATAKHSDGKGCCDQAAITAEKSSLTDFQIVGVVASNSIDHAVSQPLAESDAYALSKRPPPQTTPVSRADRLLS